MVQNTTETLTARINAVAESRFLERGQLTAVWERFGMRSTQPLNSSLTAIFRRYNSLASAIAPMAEAVSPEGQQITTSDVTCRLYQFGDNIKFTDRMVLTHEDPWMGEMSGVMGEQGTETVELVRAGVCKAGSNVTYAGGETARTSVKEGPSRADLRNVVRGFYRNRARKLTEMVGPTPYISTEPIAPAFVAFCHPDMIPVLRTRLEGWTDWERYSQQGKTLPCEFGKCEEIRFCYTETLAPWQSAGASTTGKYAAGIAVTTATACDVYPIVILARNAYGIRPLQGKGAVKVSVVNPTRSATDPHAQKGVMAWELYQGCVILNQTWMHRYEVACESSVG